MSDHDTMQLGVLDPLKKSSPGTVFDILPAKPGFWGRQDRALHVQSAHRPKAERATGGC